MEWLRKLTGKQSEKDSGSTDTKQLRVSDYLNESQISFFSAGPSKQQVLGSLIASLNLPDPSGALKAILAREEAGSTVISPGLALPHARLVGLDRLHAALGLSASGIIDAKVSSAPVHAFVLFVGPAQNMREHLAFLAAVSSLFQRDGFVGDLLKLTDPRAVLDHLRAAEGASR